MISGKLKVVFVADLDFNLEKVTEKTSAKIVVVIGNLNYIYIPDNQIRDLIDHGLTSPINNDWSVLTIRSYLQDVFQGLFDLEIELVDFEV